MWAFILFFICMEVHGKADDVETLINIKEGDILTLLPELDDLHETVQILWTFENGGLKTRLAQMHQGNIYTHYDVQFTGRVNLDRETGILTLSDIKINESGLYKALIITNKHMLGRRYKVIVYASVSLPAIRRRSSVDHSTGASQETNPVCSVLCSVKNGQDVLISWYKGGELMKQSSSPELNISLSLSLELQYEDAENYSCTAENPVSNKSIQMQIRDVCRSTQQDGQDYCGVTEALVRLVVSALLGIATVLFIFEHLRFCSSQKRAAASV
ncbi:SLAM family member 9 [Danio rerio]|uniref:SLAM family member 9 n=3 Tax=Danio rerio TaxID=7955 RepID=A0AB32TI25_DANRE